MHEHAIEEVCISRRMETFSSGGLVCLLNLSMLHAQAQAEVAEMLGSGRTVMHAHARPDEQDHSVPRSLICPTSTVCKEPLPQPPHSCFP